MKIAVTNHRLQVTVPRSHAKEFTAECSRLAVSRLPIIKISEQDFEGCFRGVQYTGSQVGP